MDLDFLPERVEFRRWMVIRLWLFLSLFKINQGSVAGVGDSVVVLVHFVLTNKYGIARVDRQTRSWHILPLAFGEITNFDLFGTDLIIALDKSQGSWFENQNKLKAEFYKLCLW